MQNNTTKTNKQGFQQMKKLSMNSEIPLTSMRGHTQFDWDI